MFGFGSNTGKWSLGGVGDRSGDFDVDTGVDGADFSDSVLIVCGDLGETAGKTVFGFMKLIGG